MEENITRRTISLFEELIFSELGHFIDPHSLVHLILLFLDDARTVNHGPPLYVSAFEEFMPAREVLCGHADLILELVGIPAIIGLVEPQELAVCLDGTHGLLDASPQKIDYLTPLFIPQDGKNGFHPRLIQEVNAPMWVIEELRTIKLICNTAVCEDIPFIELIDFIEAFSAHAFRNADLHTAVLDEAVKEWAGFNYGVRRTEDSDLLWLLAREHNRQKRGGGIEPTGPVDIDHLSE